MKVSFGWTIMINDILKDTVENVTNPVKDAPPAGKGVEDSPALSMEREKKYDSIKSRKVGIPADNGLNCEDVSAVKRILTEKGAIVKIVSRFTGIIKTVDGKEWEVDKNHITTGSIIFDAIFLPGGKKCSEPLKKQGDAIHFINETFKHCKAVAALNEGVDVLLESGIKGVKTSDWDMVEDSGVLTCGNSENIDDFTTSFAQAIAVHRHWDRGDKMNVPA